MHTMIVASLLVIVLMFVKTLTNKEYNNLWKALLVIMTYPIRGVKPPRRVLDIGGDVVLESRTWTRVHSSPYVRTPESVVML